MTEPLLFHLVIGIATLLIGLALLKRRHASWGWALCGIGGAFAVAGVLVTMVHRYRFH